MSKVGLVTKDEIKFFVNFTLGKVKVNGMLGTTMKWFLPNILDNLDDKFGDRLPEPWQTYTEQLFTKLYFAMQDNIITSEEELDIINYCGVIINAKIDIPLVAEDDELVLFMSLLKALAALLRQGVRSKKIN